MLNFAQTQVGFVAIFSSVDAEQLTSSLKWLRSKGCTFTTRRNNLDKTVNVTFKSIPAPVAAKMTERFESVRIA